jgi:DNA-binding SARP family transcriptional activator
VLWAIGTASLAVDRGDDTAARELLAAEPLSRPGTPNSWYWIDRAAVALVHVLLPEDREAWMSEVRAPVHRVGVDLALALEAARAHDLSAVRRLAWPAPGSARANLPLAWLAELAVAGFEAGNPPPPDLVDHLVAEGRSPIPRMVRRSRDPESAALLEVLAFGPVLLLRDGQPVEHEDLHRRRVRELLAVLSLGRLQRRDEIADLMWPDAADPRHNLRVTLGYLRRVIGDHPALVVDQGRVRLLTNPWLRCDLRELDELLQAADAAEREGDPKRALDRYETLLPMWRGDPFVDLGDLDWIRDEQTRRRTRFVTAAVRAGDLHLAAGSFRAALGAATTALDADRFEERAHRVAIAALLADDDLVGARAAAARCLAALCELDVAPSRETAVLIDAVAAR